MKFSVFPDSQAMTQERRRYGFVLERQCSIAKHWMAYHTTGKTVIDNNFENWQEIAASREIIPPAAYESGYSSSNSNTRRLVSYALPKEPLTTLLAVVQSKKKKPAILCLRKFFKPD